MPNHPLLILGSGPAGYAAAIYAARANLKPTLITGLEVGGQLTTTTDVDNWIGDAMGVQGPELMARMQQHALRFDTKIIQDYIVSAELSPDEKILKGEKATYSCQALIIATGASAQYLGLESEEKFMGMGVSACAVCDGFFFKDKEVAIVGGGNSALTESLYLAKMCSQVHLIHRRESFRGEKILHEQVLQKVKENKITLHLNYTTEEILGDKSGVTGIAIRHSNSQEIKQIPLEGVFIAIGHKPNTGIFQGQLKMFEHGYLQTKGGQAQFATETSMAGVFAAGDVGDPIYRQAITSAGSGCMAALDAEKYLERINSKN